MTKRFYASTGIMVALFLIGLVLARPAKLRAQEVGGATYEEAVTVGEGEHNLGKIPDPQAKYIKINVKPGQEVELIVSGPPSQYGALFLYTSGSKEAVSSRTKQLPYPLFPQKFTFAPGLKEGMRPEVILAVQGQDTSNYGESLGDISLRVALKNMSDAGSGQDAGDTFSRALAVQPGQYRGYLSEGVEEFLGKVFQTFQENGTDMVDMYTLKLKKGEKLTVSAAPHEQVKFNLKMYDGKRKVVSDDTSENSGAVVDGRILVSTDQNVYFAVRNFDGRGAHFYDLTVNVETPEGTPREAAPEPVPAGPIVIFDPLDRERLLAELGLSRNEADEETQRGRVRSDAGAFKVTLDDTQEQAVTNFVTYGISTATKKLGAGERRAVMRDYMETVGRPDVNYEDVERLSRGEKPVGRNLAKEQGQAKVALGLFKKMVGHAPNFQDSQEDLAWNTMMYRIRFSRDLQKEQAGILKFKKTFKKAPKTPMEWSAVRALGYVLE